MDKEGYMAGFGMKEGRGDKSRFDDRADKDGDGSRRSFHRKKVCRFCSDQDYLLDYKDIRMIQSFV